MSMSMSVCLSLLPFRQLTGRWARYAEWGARLPRIVHSSRRSIRTHVALCCSCAPLLCATSAQILSARLQLPPFAPRRRAPSSFLLNSRTVRVLGFGLSGCPQPSPLPRSPIEMHRLQRLQQSLYLSAYQRRQEPRQYQRRMNALWSSEARTVTASVAGSGTAPRIFKRSITAATLARKTTGSPTGSFVHCGASRLSGYPSYVPSTTRRAGSSACGPVVRWRMNESGSAKMLSGSSSGACPGPTRHWVQVRRFKRSSSDSAKQSATRPITRCKAQGASEEECGAED